MISAVIIGVIALVVSLLTLFSGFGLGTLLMPVFALFFPLEVAVASTALVHGANNLFKVGLLAKSACKDIVLRFGIPAIAGSFIGALLLSLLSHQPVLVSWFYNGKQFDITLLKLVMGLLIFGFSLFELLPSLQTIRAPVKWLPLGGILSGFFGGLSGHQGALRAVFLTPLNLSPASFAATQAVIAIMVDAMRLLVYGWGFLLVIDHSAQGAAIPWKHVIVATGCAFAGAYFGKKLLPKVTVTSLRVLVGLLLLIIGVLLLTGII